MNIPTHEEIALGAHQLWREADCPEGADVAHWLEAEHALKTAGSPASSAPLSDEAPAPEPTPMFNESYRDQAAADVPAAQAQAARAPITPRKSGVTKPPAETGKPLWSQPHSR